MSNGGDRLMAIFDSIEQVPEQYRALYSETDDGRAVLSGIDGAKTSLDVERVKKALAAERDARAQLERQLQELQRAKEVEPEAKPVGDIDAILERKLSPLKRERDEIAKKAAEYEAKIAQYESERKQMTIESSVRKALEASPGIRPTAIEDAILLAGMVFEIDEDGSVVTKSGKASMPGLSPDAWLREIRASRRHWWGDDVSVPVTGGGGAPVNNPWSKATYNLTEQIMLQTQNPQLAEMLKRSAK